MPDLSFSLGNFTITPFLISLLIVGFCSSFFIWRTLKEDVREDEIFNLTILLFVSALVFSRLIFVLFNLPIFGFSLISWLVLDHGVNFSPGGAFIGVFASAFWRAQKLKLSNWEVLDSLMLPSLIAVFLGGLGYFLKTGLVWDLFYLGTGLLGLLSYQLIKNKYRSFVWYKSGKTGFLFSFYAVYLSFFFLILAFLKNHGLYSKCLFGLLGLFFLAILYHRSERKLKEDLGFIKLKRKI
ncbi:prolipoprotein diacylglyceryl transferase [Patescibacteria group bacterium]|nr:prolipoprotein diacylglyceryl transferase [Patescibacteria group bacterium]